MSEIKSAVCSAIDSIELGGYLSIDGVFHQVTGTSIAGWCWDSARPDDALVVRIKLGEQVIATTTANLLREDLRVKGIGNGHHGFLCDLDMDIGEDGKWLVQVHANGIGGGKSLRRLKSQAEPVPAPRTDLVARLIPRCILHIGTEKTGTTTLQGMFAKNREALLAKGVLVPRTLAAPQDSFSINHVELVNYASGAGAYRAAVELKIAQEIATSGSACNILLFSSELCHSRLAAAEEIARLRYLLLSIAEKIEIVVYLRPQHEMAVSLFTTAIRNGVTEASILPDPNGISAAQSKWVNSYYNYDELVTRWEAAFGAGSVAVRIYDRDITKDFFRHLQLESNQLLDFSSLIEPIARQNIRLTASAQRVLLAVNRCAATLDRAEANRMRNRLHKALSEKLSGDHGLLPARATVEEFQGRFDASNERLRVRRFPDRKSLFPLDFSEYPEVATPWNATVDEMAAALVKLLRESKLQT